MFNSFAPESSQVSEQPMKTLATLDHGDSAVIVAVTESKIAARLGARGMVPGTELQVLRGGDPLLVGLDGARWALSALDAAMIQVESRPRRLRSLLQRFFS
ncbi:MAG: ferrous iron transport protein A [Gammaproteobacteria bacterium]|nr:ferrous iron transport protein A [Gammaproteobacteria bacterium]